MVSAIEQWMSLNKLKMNTEKIKFMILKKTQKDNVILRCSDGSLIERVDTMKYLGIIIDDKL